MSAWEFDAEAFERLPPDRRDEVRRRLKALQDLRKRDPLQFFDPHPKQHIILCSQEPIRAFLGGNRSGKTTVGIIDDLIQAVDREGLAAHLAPYKRFDPPFYCRILTPDFTATMEGVIFQKIREWAPKDQLIGGSFDKAFEKYTRVLRFKNGSWFQFMTYEQDLDKFGGAALHRIHYDEEPPPQIRQECLMRLIDYAGEELFTMTPLNGMTWMYDGVWKRRDQDGYFVVTVDMDDNPHLDEKTKVRVLEGMSAEERAARKGGRFVHFAGLIYPEFETEHHIEPERDPRKDSHIYVGIDPGQRNMAAAVYVEVDPDDQLTVFDEVTVERGTVADMADALHLRNAKWDINPRMYVIDPVARNKVHQTGRSDQMEYADHGILTIPGQNAVTAGINRVKERLQTKRLKVTANCEYLIEEFRRYRWATQAKSEHDPQEKPVKKDDHLLDALRYVCMARPGRPHRHVEPEPDDLYTRLIREDRERGRIKQPLVGPSQGGPGKFL